MWFDEALRQEGMLDWARREGRDKIVPMLAEAEQKLEDSERERKAGLLSAVRSMKDQGVPIETIKIGFPSLADEIEEL